MGIDSATISAAALQCIMLHYASVSCWSHTATTMTVWTVWRFDWGTPKLNWHTTWLMESAGDITTTVNDSDACMDWFSERMRSEAARAVGTMDAARFERLSLPLLLLLLPPLQSPSTPSSVGAFDRSHSARQLRRAGVVARSVTCAGQPDRVAVITDDWWTTAS